MKGKSGYRSIGKNRYGWTPTKGSWSGKGQLMTYVNKEGGKSTYCPASEGGKLTGGGTTSGSSGQQK
jgi:hypothetical protein